MLPIISNQMYLIYVDQCEILDEWCFGLSKDNSTNVINNNPKKLDYLATV